MLHIVAYHSLNHVGYMFFISSHTWLLSFPWLLGSSHIVQLEIIMKFIFLLRLSEIISMYNLPHNRCQKIFKILARL